jgi:hypothetical protein
MDAVLLVEVDRDGTEQFGQLARGGAAQQVHLEVAFLRMHVAERAHGVRLVRRFDGDHAELVALHRHGRGQAGERQLAVELGQAPAQQPPRRQRQDNKQQQKGEQPPPDPLHHGCSLRAGA